MKKLLTLIIAGSLVFMISCTKNSDITEDTSSEETTTEQTTTAATIVVTDTSTTTPPVTTSAKPEITLPSTQTTQETTVKETQKETEKKITLADYFIAPGNSQRPVAIMIDNEGLKSYPQGGLEKAQIVYEIIAEWGETRLVPIFYEYSKGNIGPVRSARHYYLQFAMEYDPVFVHIGFSPQAQTMIKNNNLPSLNGLTPSNYGVFFDITNDPKNWQDTYTKFELLVNHIPKLGYRKEPAKEFPFEYGEVVLAGDKVNSIELVYSRWYTAGFSYDHDTDLYARIRKGSYHVDRYTGDVLAARNIIVQKVKTYGIKNDTAGRMTMDNVGKGSGYFLTGGECVEITWEKTSDFTQTIYRLKDTDARLTLNPGQTWIMVVADDSRIILE